MQNRLEAIDLLKFIGLSGIIAAHVSPPNAVIMLRSFDVPMMVILSAYLGEMSYRRHYSGKPHAYRNYYLNRFRRLVIPTWLFLILFFSILFLIEKKRFAVRYYLYSFGLTRYGVGYVWIILIYLYGAIMVPFFSDRKLSAKGITAIITLYLLYESFYILKFGSNNKLFDSSFNYFVPYGCLLTGIGCYYVRMSKRMKKGLLFISTGLFLILGVINWWSSGSFQLVQQFKYPPRCYYLCYGIACSVGFLLLCENHTCFFARNPLVVFISKHSLWIYLWHVLVLWIYDRYNLPNIWHIKFIIVYFYAIFFTYTINILLNILGIKKGVLSFFRGCVQDHIK